MPIRDPGYPETKSIAVSHQKRVAGTGFEPRAKAGVLNTDLQHLRTLLSVRGIANALLRWELSPARGKNNHAENFYIVNRESGLQQSRGVHKDLQGILTFFRSGH